MGVKEGEVDKESQRKSVRETERGGQRKLERMRQTYKTEKERGLYFQKYLLHHHQVGLEWPIYTLLQGTS